MTTEQQKKTFGFIAELANNSEKLSNFLEFAKVAETYFFESLNDPNIENTFVNFYFRIEKNGDLLLRIVRKKSRIREEEERTIRLVNSQQIATRLFGLIFKTLYDQIDNSKDLIKTAIESK